LLQGNDFAMDFQEFQGPTVAPSACEAVSMSVDVRMVAEECSGATGNGTEDDHDLGLTISDGKYTHNGTGGVFVCGGRDLVLDGVTATDNGQYVNISSAQQYGAAHAVGINLSGTCTGNQPGTLTNVTWDGLILTDDQATPTQSYGIHRNGATVTRPVLGAVTGTGNSVALVDPEFGEPASTISGQPDFQVSLSANQSVTADTPTKIQFNTTAFDSNSAWVGTSSTQCSGSSGYCWIPPVAGKYWVHLHLLASWTTGAAADNQECRIYKDGAAIQRNIVYAPGPSPSVMALDCTQIVEMNGSTDYLEGWGIVSAPTAPIVIGGSASSYEYSYFEADYLGP
jgi:hypothetical protein